MKSPTTNNPKAYSKTIALALLIATATGIASYPFIKQAQATQTAQTTTQIPAQSHRIEVVFVLDTTSSMSGLIHAAREKIWSIATTMTSAQQNPDIRMGLVAFRDRGDAYITRTYDLSSDLDSMYANLMDFRAQGGGDGPESVNQALHDAVHDMSWSDDRNTYKVVFLVGDAPPHMDYPNDVKYPVTLEAARLKGIVVNAIQSGQHQYTRPAWQQIASLGQGEYFQVEDSGNTVAVATPYDEKLSAFAAELEATRLYFGDKEEKKTQQARLNANLRLRKELSTEALARRDTFNATVSGKANLLGSSELVDAITSGRIELDEIGQENLPASLQAMAPAEQMAVIGERARRRDELQQQIHQLSASRSSFIKQKVEAEGGADDSLDEKIYRAVKDQAASVGLTYDSDSASY
ncbi:MAG TPA: VWA domain-containing protein [Gammaproteobacteria bacterium]|nr:VWA domain-containing protein [Gammaproteobacteria bacterium]